jgi:glycosyltransferase involved in cell wall biosynthesis
MTTTKQNYILSLILKMRDYQINVQFISETSTPDDYYSIFDVFCLTSREEALGLVAIENMKYGTPVICFERCGGIEEFADRNASIKVPYLDLNEYSNKIYQILMDYELKTTLTNNATEIIKNEFDIERIGSSIMNEISKIIQS